MVMGELSCNDDSSINIVVAIAVTVIIINAA